jgi:hypothetical protein
MKLHCPSPVLSLAAALLLAAVAVPASAHHSAAPFDMSKQITVRGTVEKWQWSNPHSWLYVRVENADGSADIWGFEAGSTGMLARGGWNAADMKAGDKVTVGGAPERSGSHVALLNQVELADGRVLKAGFGAVPPGAGSPPPGAGGLPPGALPPGVPSNAPSPR